MTTATCQAPGCGRPLPPRRRRFCSDECSAMSHIKGDPVAEAEMALLRERQDREYIDLANRINREMVEMKQRHLAERVALETRVPLPPGKRGGRS